MVPPAPSQPYSPLLKDLLKNVLVTTVRSLTFPFKGSCLEPRQFSGLWRELLLTSDKSSLCESCSAGSTTRSPPCRRFVQTDERMIPCPIMPKVKVTQEIVRL